MFPKMMSETVFEIGGHANVHQKDTRPSCPIMTTNYSNNRENNRVYYEKEYSRLPR